LEEIWQEEEAENIRNNGRLTISLRYFALMSGGQMAYEPGRPVFRKAPEGVGRTKRGGVVALLPLESR